MMNKRFCTLGLILLLVIPVSLLVSGCDSETYTGELEDAIQGRYTIEGEDGVVAYLDLSDGRYSVIPIEDSAKPLEELGILFFGENPEGTYTMMFYSDGISEKTTLEDLDEKGETGLGIIGFTSDDRLESFSWALDYSGPREEIYFSIFFNFYDPHPEFISKPWE